MLYLDGEVNECLDDDICGFLGQCRNTIGSYFCICPFRELYDEDTNKCLSELMILTVDCVAILYSCFFNICMMYK